MNLYQQCIYSACALVLVMYIHIGFDSALYDSAPAGLLLLYAKCAAMCSDASLSCIASYAGLQTWQIA